jgi:hypothetical protein
MTQTTSLSSWERIISIATLGTRRAPLPKEGLWPESSLESVASRTSSSELALLRAAAAAWLFEVAGRRPAAHQETASFRGFPSVSDQDFVAQPAAWRLGRMINGEHRELIDEWFTLAQSAGKSLPPHWLPAVLGSVSSQVRNGYPDVLGPAATWLAERNPNWKVTGIGEPSERRWQDGTLEERRAEFMAIRSRDAAQARSWLESTWPTDPADAREEFLKIMRIGLSTEDEPFLEAALDDKRKGVRLAAAECLSRLPSSRHAQRNLARLEPLLALEAQKSGLIAKLRKRKLQIELPATLDKAALRDGMESKPPSHRKIGDRAFWLTQMIAMARPRHWCERFDCDATTLMAAAMTTDYAAELLAAWSAATVRHPDREWISVLVETWIESKNEPILIAREIAALLDVATPDEQGTLLESLLRTLAARDFNITLYLLSSLELSWSASITSLALQTLDARARTDPQQWSHARNTLDTWGRRCDVETAAALLPNLLSECGETSPWRNALDQMNDLVVFRAAMKRELLT